MMVDLEDDPEWSVSDELDDEDSERYLVFFFSFFHCQKLNNSSNEIHAFMMKNEHT